jgi:hypothetical protein
MSMPLSNTPVGPHHRVERVAVYGRPREETPAPQPSTVELLTELIARVDATSAAPMSATPSCWPAWRPSRSRWLTPSTTGRSS